MKPLKERLYRDASEAGVWHSCNTHKEVEVVAEVTLEERYGYGTQEPLEGDILVDGGREEAATWNLPPGTYQIVRKP